MPDDSYIIEKKFYKRHSSEIVKFQSFDTELDEIYKDFFATGKRYNILENILDPSHEYNLLVEIGSGGGATLKYLNEKFKFKNIVGYDLFFEDAVLKSNKYKNINGVSIAPKKEFNILKIWLRNHNENYDEFIKEYGPNFTKEKALIKKHELSN